MPDVGDVIQTLVFSDHEAAVQEGVAIGACLMRSGMLIVRRSDCAELRGMYCAIGACNECLVTVDGARNVGAYVAKSRPGTVIQTRNDIG